jgi:chemotaxis protein histidine kinase CheA
VRAVPTSSAAFDVSGEAFDPLPALNTLRQRAAKGQIDPDLLLVIDALDQRARHFSQMAASLQEEVKSLRTVPLDDVFRRLQRPLRDAARQEGKFVDLLVAGGELRVDRTVAERLSAPLLHLLRNAVAHGIEVPALREARGKARSGTIQISASQGPRAIEVSVADDGNGLDFVAIRNKAAALGWLGSAEPTPQELAQLIFRPGFSTRDEVNELAGRGVGMDVVAREIEALKGRVDVSSVHGKGTTFRISLPTGAGTGGP